MGLLEQYKMRKNKDKVALKEIIRSTTLRWQNENITKDEVDDFLFDLLNLITGNTVPKIAFYFFGLFCGVMITMLIYLFFS